MEDNSVHLEMQADCLLILSCLCELNGHRKVWSSASPIHKNHCFGSRRTVWWIWWYPSTNTVPQEGPTEVLKWSGSPPPVASSYRLHLVRIVFWLSTSINLQICSPGVLWSGNNMVEDIFLENEGVFVLLDLLLVSSARLHSYMYWSSSYRYHQRTCVVLC